MSFSVLVGSFSRVEVVSVSSHCPESCQPFTVQPVTIPPPPVLLCRPLLWSSLPVSVEYSPVGTRLLGTPRHLFGISLRRLHLRPLRWCKVRLLEVEIKYIIRGHILLRTFNPNRRSFFPPFLPFYCFLSLPPFSLLFSPLLPLSFPHLPFFPFPPLPFPSPPLPPSFSICSNSDLRYPTFLFLRLQGFLINWFEPHLGSRRVRDKVTNRGSDKYSSRVLFQDDSCLRGVG